MGLTDEELNEMKKDINLLHDVLSARGVNSRRTADIFGREVRSRLQHLQCARARGGSSRLDVGFRLAAM